MECLLNCWVSSRRATRPLDEGQLKWGRDCDLLWRSTKMCYLPYTFQLHYKTGFLVNPWALPRGSVWYDRPCAWPCLCRRNYTPEQRLQRNEELLEAVNRHAVAVGIRINASKTKMMSALTPGELRHTVLHVDEALKVIGKLQYLDLMLITNGPCTEEIRSRIMLPILYNIPDNPRLGKAFTSVDLNN